MPNLVRQNFMLIPVMTSRKTIQWTIDLFLFINFVKTLALILMIYRIRPHQSTKKYFVKILQSFIKVMKDYIKIIKEIRKAFIFFFSYQLNESSRKHNLTRLNYDF